MRYDFWRKPKHYDPSDQYVLFRPVSQTGRWHACRRSLDQRGWRRPWEAFHYNGDGPTFAEQLTRTLKTTAQIAADPFSHLPAGLGIVPLGARLKHAVPEHVLTARIGED